MRNKYRIEIVVWSLDSTKLQRKLVNDQFILGGGGGKNARHRGRQTNGENKNREPSTFYFFLIFRIMLNFFEEPKFIKEYIHHNVKGHLSVKISIYVMILGMDKGQLKKKLSTSDPQVTDF